MIEEKMKTKIRKVLKIYLQEDFMFILEILRQSDNY